MDTGNAAARRVGSTLTGTFRARMISAGCVLGIVLFFGLGLPVVNSLIPGLSDVSGQDIHIGHGVNITAPPGSYLDVDRHHPNSDRLELLINGLTLTIQVRPYDGDAAGLAQVVDGELKAQPGIQLAGEEQPCVTSGGTEGIKHTFRSPSTEGYFCVFVVDRIGVDLVAWSSNRRGFDEGAYVGLEQALSTLRFGEVPSA